MFRSDSADPPVGGGISQLAAYLVIYAELSLFISRGEARLFSACRMLGPILFAQNSVFLGGAWSFTETQQKEWFFGDGARMTSEQLQSRDHANGGKTCPVFF